MQSSTYFLNKAERCRRLAAAITARNDSAIATLLALAAEFEAQAIDAAIREGEAMAAHHPPPGGVPAGADGTSSE
jgi:hypothetical protein